MIRKLFRKMGHGALALLVFVTLTLTLLWLTGTFSGGRANAAAKAPAEDGHGHAQSAAAAEDAHAHGQAKEAAGHDDHDGHAHGAAESKAPANLDPKVIEAKKCEHNIPQVQCDECRYELGVVKVDPSVTKALTNTAKAATAPAVKKLQLTGEVQFDQTRVVDVLPVAAGKVVAVNAHLGQPVKQGQVLAVLRSGEFGEAKAAYLEAQATAEIAANEKERQATVTAALEKLLANLARAPSAPEMAGEPLGEWKSKLIGAAARLHQARLVAEREKGLVAKQASSQAELETAQRELQTAQADYAALVEEVQLNLKLNRLKADNAARLAEAKLAAADQRLHLFGLDDDAMRALLQMKENGRFAELPIRAPRDGVITAQNLTEGKLVEPNQTLFTIADLSNLWVWCQVYERDLGSLHEFLAAGKLPAAAVRVRAFAEPFAGAVDLVGSTVDEATRTVKVRVQLKNEAAKLKPGMFATVDVELPTGKQVTLVPRQAVLSDEGQAFAFEHWKDDLWLRRNLVLGEAQEDQVQVVSGLEPGARVVTRGGFLFKSDVLRAKMGAGCAD